MPRTRYLLGADGPSRVDRPDVVVVEEPLEIRVGKTAITTTMRTPGDDFDLALGHLLTTGLIAAPDDVRSMMHCTDVDESGSPTFNVVEVALASGVTLRREPAARTSVANSACGVCGTQQVADVLALLPTRHTDEHDHAAHLTIENVQAMVEQLSTRQPVFATTGGVHAAALFTLEGECRVSREDVGRHNAVDKVLGAAARDGLWPAPAHLLVVSSRAGFEIVQKAVAAELAALVCVGAATSLAVDLAHAGGLTLVAFARPGSMAVYSHGDRFVPRSERTEASRL